MRGEHGVVRVGERNTMDADEVLRDRPLAWLQLQGGKMVVRGFIGALGQVQDHLLLAGDVLEELLPVLGDHVGDVRGRRRKARVTS